MCPKSTRQAGIRVVRARRRHRRPGRRLPRIYDAATVIIAVTAIVTALLRIIMREKSPWKVRSVLFDAIIGIGLGLGLLLLYFAPSLFWIR